MACHKPFSAITHESCFQPIHVGAIKVEDYLVMYIQEELFGSGSLVNMVLYQNGFEYLGKA